MEPWKSRRCGYSHSSRVPPTLKYKRINRNSNGKNSKNDKKKKQKPDVETLLFRFALIGIEHLKLLTLKRKKNDSETEFGLSRSLLVRRLPRQ